MLRFPAAAGPAVRSPVAAYLLGLAAVAVAAALRQLLDPWMGSFAPYATMYGAVAVTVWFAGAGPAIVAGIVGFLVTDYLFIEPRGSVDIFSPAVLTAFIAYALSSGLIVFFGEGLHRANRRLRARSEILGFAMAAGAMGTWSRDLREAKIWWSPELEQIFGLAPGTFDGTESGFFSLVHADDRARVADAVARAIEERGEYSVEFRYRRYNTDEWRWMEGRGKVSCDASDVPVAVYGIGIDVTERRREQQRLRESEEGLRQSDRRKTEFIAALSHELRNPLAPMRNALRILQLTGNIPEPARALHDMLNRQVEHMARLVDDLLDLSRITRGRIELRIEPVALGPELRATVDACRTGFGADARELVLDLPAEELVVMADRVRLQQIVENLVNNAIKFTHDGGRIEVSARATDAGEVEIRVRDDGIGIAPEDLQRIWELFVQVDESAEGLRRGLGIGLAMVKDLAARHGGSVSVESPGRSKGSTFTVRLPRAASAPGTA